jgi:hypothetical protein
MSIRRSVTVAAGLAVLAGLSAFAQPGQPAQKGQPKEKERLPGQRDSGQFYRSYHMTQSDDGRTVYLWGFDPDTGETRLIASEETPEDWQDLEPQPGKFREYYFAHSKDGRRVFVWGFNPGEGKIRLVSTARTTEQRPREGQPFGGDNERRQREEERRRNRER